MYLCLLLLPILALLINLMAILPPLFGGYLAVKTLLTSTIIALLCFVEVVYHNAPLYLHCYTLVALESFTVEFTFLFDTLGILKIFLVLFITSLVILYSLEYLGSDPHLSRFVTILCLFAFSMLLLILADNFLVLFIGWEFVGVISYLLVNFWHTRLKANVALLKALFLNKIGDATFLVSLVLLYLSVHDFNYSTTFATGYLLEESLLAYLLVGFIVAASAKSALLGLHTWLPSAKEGPTPVSALLHSATKVTAGIILTIRISPLLELVPDLSFAILFLGASTALIGGASALIGKDVKKIIAYSTSSQLGYKAVASGLSLYHITLFHVLNHAFFKSLLFLAAGAIIHAKHDNQDIRKYGALIVYLPLTYLLFLCGTLSLIAFPFFSGFYSKDLLLLLMTPKSTKTLAFAYILCLTAAFLTCLYSVRTLILSFLTYPNFLIACRPYIQDPSPLKRYPKIILSLAALLFGYLSQHLFIAYGLSSMTNSYFVHPSHLKYLNGCITDLSFIHLIPLVTLALYLLLAPHHPQNRTTARTISTSLTPLVDRNPYLSLKHAFMSWDIFVSSLIVFYYTLSTLLYRSLDKGLLELIGPLGATTLLHYLSYLVSSYSTLYLLHYLLYALLFFVLLKTNMPVLWVSFFYLTCTASLFVLAPRTLRAG